PRGAEQGGVVERRPVRAGGERLDLRAADPLQRRRRFCREVGRGGREVEDRIAVDQAEARPALGEEAAEPHRAPAAIAARCSGARSASSTPPSMTARPPLRSFAFAPVSLPISVVKSGLWPTSRTSPRPVTRA